jgi:hypothetical protein
VYAEGLHVYVEVSRVYVEVSRVYVEVLHVYAEVCVCTWGSAATQCGKALPYR